MTSRSRTALFLAGVSAAVVLASLYYARTVRQAPAAETAPAPPVATAESIDPAQLHAGLRDGLRAMQDSRLEEARTSLESVPATDPGYLIARQNLVAVLVRSGDFAAAARVLDELSRLQPDSSSIAEHLAWVHYRLGHYETAELYALRGLEIDGRQPQLRYAVGLFRVAAGRTVDAIAAYKRGMETDTERRHVTDALGRLMALGQQRPDLAGVHYLLAFFANALGQTSLEIQELERYLALETTGATATAARARLAAARGGGPTPSTGAGPPSGS